MKLYGRKVLILAADGGEYSEILDTRRAFEREGAVVFITAPSDHMTIETVEGGRSGGEILLDFPLAGVDPELFDALVIPDGLLAADILAKSDVAKQVISDFHTAKRPICASGQAEKLLVTVGIDPHPLVLREEDELPGFLQRSIELVMESPSRYEPNSQN